MEVCKCGACGETFLPCQTEVYVPDPTKMFYNIDTGATRVESLVRCKETPDICPACCSIDFAKVPNERVVSNG
jgi:hypothetical protein